MEHPKGGFLLKRDLTVRQNVDTITGGGVVMDIRVGDKIKLKKSHPCGSFEWEVLRVGIDFRLKCCGCGHMLMIPRKQAEKSIKTIIKETGNEEH